MLLKDKVMPVTGAASGIGRAIAITAARDRASFVTGSYYPVVGGYFAR